MRSRRSWRVDFLFLFCREIQTIVLKSIASIADKHKQIFEPYLKSFYVHSNDSGLVKHYKLEILTILANASNISIILREFQVSEIIISIVKIIFFVLDLCPPSR